MSVESRTDTKVHAALAIPELRGAICGTGVLHRTDLRNLCLASRSWRSAAEPELWKDLSGLNPLLYLLPQDALHQRDRYSDDREPIRFRRALRSEDWTAFIRVAPYVRSLRLDFKAAVRRGEQESIVRCLPADPLLPLLQTLDVRFDEGVYVANDFMRLLLSQTVTVLKLDIGYCSPAVPCAFLAIASLDNLSSLELNCAFSSLPSGGLPVSATSFCRSLGDLLAGRASLERVGLTILSTYTPEILPALAGIPCLQSLDVLLQIEDLANEDVLPPCAGFASLQSLACTNCPLPLLRAILRAHAAHALRKVTAYTAIHTSDALAAVLGEVRARCRPDTLTEVSLHNRRVWIQLAGGGAPIAEAPVVLRKGALALLADCRALSTLAITSVSSIDLAGVEWEEVAGWWPRLAHLRLESDATAPARVPLAALSHFARNCPQLTYLGLPVDASVVPKDIDVSHRSRGTVEIRLGVEDAPIGDADAVARYLLEIFPNLTIVLFREGRRLAERDSANVLWNRVNDRLRGR